MPLLIPAWHIGVLALVYAIEKMVWFFKRPETKFSSLGMALGRFILACVYFYIAIVDPSEFQKMYLVRWSLFLFLGIDLFFIGQLYIIDRIYGHVE